MSADSSCHGELANHVSEWASPPPFLLLPQETTPRYFKREAGRSLAVQLIDGGQPRSVLAVLLKLAARKVVGSWLPTVWLWYRHRRAGIWPLKRPPSPALLLAADFFGQNAAGVVVDDPDQLPPSRCRLNKLTRKVRRGRRSSAGCCGGMLIAYSPQALMPLLVSPAGWWSQPALHMMPQVKEIALEGTWKAEETHRKAHQHDAAAAAEAVSSAAEAAAEDAPAARGRWLHWT